MYTFMEKLESDNIHKSKAYVDFMYQKLQYFQSLEQFKNRVLSFSFYQLAAMHNIAAKYIPKAKYLLKIFLL